MGAWPHLMSVDTAGWSGSLEVKASYTAKLAFPSSYALQLLEFQVVVMSSKKKNRNKTGEGKTSLFRDLVLLFYLVIL